MTISVIIAFLVCWAPYFIIGLIRIYSEYQLKMKLPLAVAEIMAMSHSALNPFLYVIFNTNLTMKRFWMKVCCKETVEDLTKLATIIPQVI